MIELPSDWFIIVYLNSAFLICPCGFSLDSNNNHLISECMGDITASLFFLPSFLFLFFFLSFFYYFFCHSLFLFHEQISVSSPLECVSFFWVQTIRSPNEGADTKYRRGFPRASAKFDLVSCGGRGCHFGRSIGMVEVCRYSSLACTGKGLVKNCRC